MCPEAPIFLNSGVHGHFDSEVVSYLYLFKICYSIFGNHLTSLTSQPIVFFQTMSACNNAWLPSQLSSGSQSKLKPSKIVMNSQRWRNYQVSSHELVLVQELSRCIYMYQEGPSWQRNMPKYIPRNEAEKKLKYTLNGEYWVAIAGRTCYRKKQVTFFHPVWSPSQLWPLTHQTEPPTDGPYGSCCSLLISLSHLYSPCCYPLTSETSDLPT